jgi:hypothetical protein
LISTAENTKSNKQKPEQRHVSGLIITTAYHAVERKKEATGIFIEVDASWCHLANYEKIAI